MKNKGLKWLALCVSIGLAGCDQNFLDLKPYDSVPFSDAIKTESDMSIAVNGMYSGLRSANLYGRTIPFIYDLMADNVYISATNSGRYLPQSNYSVNAQNGDIGGTWASAYNVILRANNIINATLAESATTKQLKGEALTIRALMHWELVRLFGKSYTDDPNAAGIPVVLKYEGPTTRPSRNSVKDVYTQIVQDLTQAFDLMTNTSKNSSYITKYASKALLAKVYFQMGDYKNAQTAAQDVVTNGGFKLVNAAGYGAYWTNAAPITTKNETIFEVASDAVNNAGFDALVNMYAQLGYGDGLCSTALYNLYTDSDVRKALVVKGTRGGSAALIVNKYQNISNANDKDDTKVARLSELYLIIAESAARQGDEATALKFLNDVAKNRDASFAGFTSTGATLIEDIITERRKEFAFEGNRYQDLQRLKRDVTRTAEYPSAARSITATDTRRIAPIPQVEIDANPNMTQNAGY